MAIQLFILDETTHGVRRVCTIELSHNQILYEIINAIIIIKKNQLINI